MPNQSKLASPKLASPKLAIVLGGGRSERMGANKLTLRVEGETLLQRTVQASLEWADLVVVAGPELPAFSDWSDDPRISFAVEQPRFGGPAAGIGAAFETLVGDLDETPVMVLAGDLADPDAVVNLLKNADSMGNASDKGLDGVILREEDGWPQYLAGIYRFASLGHALRELGAARDASVRTLMRPLHLHELPVPKMTLRDVDTPTDWHRTFGPETPRK